MTPRRRRRQLCEDCDHPHFRRVDDDRRCVRCGGRVFVTARKSKPSQGELARIDLWVPAAWRDTIDAEGPSRQHWVRVAIARRLGVPFE